MTAEIVIMNNEAIALAADSAVTMEGAKEQKIFTSANKLFALSKYQPVGVMVYGNATLMQIPWETIIKIYRNQLKGKRFDTLSEYAQHFVGFLDNGNPLFSKETQHDYFTGAVNAYFHLIRDDILDKVRKEIYETDCITDSKVRIIVAETIKSHYLLWSKTDNVPTIPNEFNEAIIKKYETEIMDVMKDVFQRLPTSERQKKQLASIAASLFARFPQDMEIEAISGLVIAGFGEKDVFPSVESFHLDGVFENRLKYQKINSSRISTHMGASILPFAQGEMVSTFMEGIDPGLHSYIQDYLITMLEKYPETILNKLPGLEEKQKAIILGKLRKAGRSVFKDYEREIQEYKEREFINPIMEVVAMLPKDELASMAEALVNLTSFKRRVSLSSENVAGPIDVAVISKGDGLVWIKRKHYFKAELNPQFISSYYRRVQDDEN